MLTQMTRTDFAFCVIVSVALAFGAIGCRPPEVSQASKSGVPRPSASATPAITPSNNNSSNNSTAPKPKVEPYLSRDVEIVATEYTERNERLHCDLDISYPQIRKPRTPQERKFNYYVQNMIEREVRYFKAYCSKERKYPDGRKRLEDYHLGTSFKPLYVTRELVSINITMESYSGYLNSDWFPMPVNYDLKAGRPIKKLAALFKPKSNYLQTIAEYSIADLLKRKDSHESSVRTGTEPKSENYTAWNLTRDGVQINFGEYQVGPGAIGLVSVVVPYEHLQGILKREFKSLRPEVSEAKSQNRIRCR